MLTELWQKTSNPNGECMEVRWVKSPFSQPNDYDCLEARWQNASNPSGSCLDARWAGGWVETRNSNDPDGPVVRYTPAEWRAFLRGVRETDTFDLPAGV